MPTRVKKGLTCTMEWYKTLEQAMKALRDFRGDAYRDSQEDGYDGYCIVKMD